MQKPTRAICFKICSEKQNHIKHFQLAHLGNPVLSAYYKVVSGDSFLHFYKLPSSQSRMESIPRHVIMVRGCRKLRCFIRTDFFFFF